MMKYLTYVITARSHGFNGTPCNVNATLFGEFARHGDDFSESSHEFETRDEAEAALALLLASGDWPDGRPIYEIEELT